MKRLFILSLFCISICGCNSNEVNNIEIKNVTCDEKNEILKENKNAILIDVRTKEEYDSGHIEKAINIPYDKIVDTLSTYGTIDFDTPIIVYCKSGGRSNMAAESLISSGYKNIYDLGAMSNCDWVN